MRRHHKMPLRAVLATPDDASGGGSGDVPLASAPLGTMPVLRAAPELADDEPTSDAGTVFGSPPMPGRTLPPPRTIPAAPVPDVETTDTTGRQPTNPAAPIQPGSTSQGAPVAPARESVLTPALRRALLIGAGVVALVVVVVLVAARRRRK